MFLFFLSDSAVFSGSSVKNERLLNMQGTYYNSAQFETIVLENHRKAVQMGALSFLLVSLCLLKKTALDRF